MFLMGLIQNHRQRRLIPPLIFLLIISTSRSTHSRLFSEARAQPSQNQVDQKTMSEIRTHVIGSRPPRCQFRCSGCGPCEAVQVPVIPQQQQQKVHRSRESAICETRELLFSRGDDVTNYKPMGWKCKCGNLFFNP